MSWRYVEEMPGTAPQDGVWQEIDVARNTTRRTDETHIHVEPTLDRFTLWVNADPVLHIVVASLNRGCPSVMFNRLQGHERRVFKAQQDGVSE